MTFRYLPFVFGMAASGALLAGCTSSEPQNPAYSASSSAVVAPSRVEPTVDPLTMPSPAGQATSAPVNTMQPKAAAPDAGMAAGFPAPPTCTGSNDAGCAPVQAANNCRTVGNVTTCDAPANPAAEDTLYTN